MKIERLRKMEDFIEEKQSVTMEDLCQAFGISINTARADINMLVQRGAVKKVYGGVEYVSKESYTSYEVREKINAGTKRLIAQKAAEYIENNDIIFIDAGTTTSYILDYLDPSKKVTVMTNSLTVINRAAVNERIALVSIAGIYRRATNSFISVSVEQDIRRYNISKAFMATTGIDMNGNITNSTLQEYEIKKSIVENAKTKYLAADSSKIGRPALFTFATIAQMDVFLTDSDISEIFLKQCKHSGVAVITAARSSAP